jgi:hypothetical protein
MMSSKEKLIQEIEQAPDYLIEEVLDFLLFTKTRRNQQTTNSETEKLLEKKQSKQRSGQKSQPIWELFEEFTNDLPEETISELPTDGAAQIDRYLYGKPKHE